MDFLIPQFLNLVNVCSAVPWKLVPLEGLPSDDPAKKVHGPGTIKRSMRRTITKYTRIAPQDSKGSTHPKQGGCSYHRVGLGN